MKLTTDVTADAPDWYLLQEGEYIIVTDTDNNKVGIVFKCPGCTTPLSVTIKNHLNEPGWAINFDTLTSTPSILHSREGRGCGWHGYLVNAEFRVA